MTQPESGGPFDYVQTDLGARATEILSGHPAQGPIHMLNLLKFVPEGGEEAYSAYVAATQPLTEHFGVTFVTAVKPAEALIGDRYWDVVAIFKYPSRQAAIDMLNTRLYAACEPMRTQSLEDSELHVTDPVSF